MKNIKTFPVARKDVEKLSDETLLEIIEFKNNALYKVLKEVAEDYKMNLGREAFNVTEISQLQLLLGKKLGVDFIFDIVDRANEELTFRQSKKDKKK